jgi:hypothetical protein
VGVWPLAGATVARLTIPKAASPKVQRMNPVLPESVFVGVVIIPMVFVVLFSVVLTWHLRGQRGPIGRESAIAPWN